MSDSQNLSTVLGSVIQVLGVVAVAWAYSRKFHPDLEWTMRLGMHLLLPCLAFTTILDSRIESHALAVAAGATGIQILTGLVLGWVVLWTLGWKEKRELLLPMIFVNSVNLPFPLLLANFGEDGLSLGVICNTVTNLFLFSLGVMILHGGGRMRQALKEPALWATLAAGLLRIFHVQPPELAMKIPRLAGSALVPLMLILFGDSLARTRLTSVRPALVVTLTRYLTGAIGLAITLILLRPTGMLRQVLVLYALLPPAMINALMVQKSGRDERSVASSILLATLAAVVILPLVLVWVK